VETPVKVLQVIEDLGIGGAEKLLATVLPLLPERGILPEVAVLGAREDFVPVLQRAGVRVHVLGLQSYRRPVKAVRWLVDLLQHGSFELVHTHLAHANLYGRVAARLARIPATSTYHDTDYEPEVLIDNPEFQPWKQSVYRYADRLTAFRCTPVVAVSDFVAGSVSRRLGYLRAQVEVIHNGVPMGAIARGEPKKNRREYREKLDLPPNVRVVVQVGRLTAQKGQLHTLEAAALLRDERDLLWVFVGDGPLRSRLETKRGELGLQDVVRFAGNRKDVKAYLMASDVFVFPSLHEGLGIAALEAMAVGLPVVAYRTGPIPEVVVDGETGVLVDPGNHLGLASSVRALLNGGKTASTMGDKGRQRVMEHFLVDATADRHAAFYRRQWGGGSER